MAINKFALGVTITGDKEIDNNLRFLPRRLQLHLVREATAVAARQVVLPNARKLAPRDTGALASSLRVRNIRSGESAGTNRNTPGLVDRGMRDVIGSQVYTHRKSYESEDDFHYASAVELGLKERDYEAQPFLRPALYDHKFLIRSIFVRALRRFIGKRSASD